MDELLVTHTAILGRSTLPPGIQRVKVGDPQREYLVSYTYSESIIDERRDIKVDVADCTVFTVQHLQWNGADLTDRSVQADVLERSLLAISEVLIWFKTKDLVGKITSYARQVGRLDVKVFFVDGPNGSLAAWKNPAFWTDLTGFNFFAGFLANMIVENGPAANPTSQIIRRIMSAIDLFNLGFYTESFITAFSLCDDLVQRVVKAGMSRKGLDSRQQEELLRSIMERRLASYSTHLMQLCDWESLANADPKLFKGLMSTNKLRNDIMHGDRRISRADTLASLETILATIAWLRSNPFGYEIEPYPIFSIPDPEFTIFKDNAPDQAETSGEKTSSKDDTPDKDGISSAETSSEDAPSSSEEQQKNVN